MKEETLRYLDRNNQGQYHRSMTTMTGDRTKPEKVQSNWKQYLWVWVVLALLVAVWGVVQANMEEDRIREAGRAEAIEDAHEAISVAGLSLTAQETELVEAVYRIAEFHDNSWMEGYVENEFYVSDIVWFAHLTCEHHAAGSEAGLSASSTEEWLMANYGWGDREHDETLQVIMGQATQVLCPS